jgi:hypothetical protein
MKTFVSNLEARATYLKESNTRFMQNLFNELDIAEDHAGHQGGVVELQKWQGGRPRSWHGSFLGDELNAIGNNMKLMIGMKKCILHDGGRGREVGWHVSASARSPRTRSWRRPRRTRPRTSPQWSIFG